MSARTCESFKLSELARWYARGAGWDILLFFFITLEPRVE